MTNLRSVGYSFFFVVAATLLSRCQRSGGPSQSQSDTSCLIASANGVYFGDTTTITFSYDNQRRLISWHIANPAQDRTFRYGVGYIIITNSNGPSDSVVLNPNGSVSVQYIDDGTAKATYTYSYSNNGLLTQRTQKLPTLQPHITEYTWVNGDMISDSDGDLYTFDTAKKSRVGDNWVMSQLFEYGNVAYSIHNSHMQSTWGSTTAVINCQYNYDAAGKVISYTSENTALALTYNCY